MKNTMVAIGGLVVLMAPSVFVGARAADCPDLSGDFSANYQGQMIGMSIRQHECASADAVLSQNSQVVGTETWIADGVCRTYYVVGGNGPSSNQGNCAELRFTATDLSGDIFAQRGAPARNGHISMSLNAAKNLVVQAILSAPGQPDQTQTLTLNRQ